MSCRASINRDLEFTLAHVALAALRRDDHKWCEVCKETTNHRQSDHERVERDDDVSDEDAREPEGS